MARIVITYAANDRSVAVRIETWLARAGHNVVSLQGLRLSGEGLKDRAVVEITQANYVLAILSRNSWASPGFAFELGLVRTFELTLQRNVLMGLVIDDGPVPTVLGSRPTIRLSTQELEGSLDLLEAMLHRPVVDVAPTRQLAFGQAQALIATGQAVPAWTQGIAELASALTSRQLVLFLGAGVSSSAGVPTWQTLVDRVMGEVFDRAAAGTGLASDQLASLMRVHTKASDLVLAQHARRELGEQFYRVVQTELYRGARGISDLITALGELAERRRPKAAVTYNFDVFFERELRRRGLKHQVVTKEGARSSDGLPVFHVHGLIKPTGYVERGSLVFAESQFHDESLDPYRWSSLVQLSHLSHSTCLFVGSSVQDPNLRRLLEVVKKRSPEDVSPHFVVYKHTDATEVARDVNPPLSAAQATQATEVIDHLLEGDLNDLGLQVIWVQTYNEITNVVMDLASNPAVAAGA